MCSKFFGRRCKRMGVKPQIHWGMTASRYDASSPGASVVFNPVVRVITYNILCMGCSSRGATSFGFSLGAGRWVAMQPCWTSAFCHLAFGQLLRLPVASVSHLCLFSSSSLHLSSPVLSLRFCDCPSQDGAVAPAGRPLAPLRPMIRLSTILKTSPSPLHGEQARFPIIQGPALLHEPAPRFACRSRCDGPSFLNVGLRLCIFFVNLSGSSSCRTGRGRHGCPSGARESAWGARGRRDQHEDCCKEALKHVSTSYLLKLPGETWTCHVALPAACCRYVPFNSNEKFKIESEIHRAVAIPWESNNCLRIRLVVRNVVI